MSQCSIVSPKDPNAPPKVMTFDGAYYTDSTTEAIYNEISFPLVEVRLKYYLFIAASTPISTGMGDCVIDIN